MAKAAAWDSDLLDRKSDALFLIDFIVRKLEERGKRGSTRSFVLNIDAGWGQGKTYFLENLKATLERQNYVVAQVNAWLDDHADDPLLPFMSAIEKAVGEHSKAQAKKPLSKFTQIGGQVVAAAAKGLAKQTFARYAGEDTLKQVSELIGDAGAEAAKSAGKEAITKLGDIYDAEGKLLLEKFRIGQKTISEFRKQMADLVASFKPEYKKPLFILVDELDRCRPPYAVALLERVKHLFDVDDVVFVMATDTEQLRHSIGALYGVNFAAGRYLLRFFDQTYRFEDAAVDQFVEQQFLDIDKSTLFGSPQLGPVEFTAQAFKAFHLSLRDIEQCADIIRNCVTAWNSPSQLVLFMLLPLVVLQQQRMQVSYSKVWDRLNSQLGNVHWKLDLNVWDESRKKKIFDGPSLFGQFVSNIQAHNLPYILNDDDRSADVRAIKDMLTLEMRALYAQGYQSNRPPMSLIRDYPTLVRTVGRLTPA